MDIVITESSYTLLLIFLIYGTEEKIIITSDNMKKLNLKIDYKIKLFKIKLFYFFYLLYLKFYLLKYDKKRYKRVIGSGHLIYSNFIIRDKEFIMIEDGLKNYNVKQDVNKSRIKKLKYFLGYLPPEIEMKRASKIFLTEIHEIPSNIKEKVEIIDIFKLWHDLKKDNKEKILNIFGLNLNKIKRLEKRKILLLTQPLSEDNILSEKEKVNLYKKVLAEYNQEEIIIKAHPREKTDYQLFFPKIEIIENIIPIELLRLNNFEVEEVITLFSTGVLSYKDKAKISFYGTEVHPRLLEKFGSLEYLIKRNKFIKSDKCM